MTTVGKHRTELTKIGEVAVLSFFNEPADLMTFELIDDMIAHIRSVAESEARALLIRGEGPHFCGGVNVGVFQDVSERLARVHFSRALPLFVHALENLPIPVVMPVQGLCAAAGLELALTADYLVAGRSALFSQVEAKIGTATLLGGVQRLAERCGSVRAKEICFTGRHFDAETFERWNIINRVVPDEVLQAEALAIAEEFARGPTRAHFVTKLLVRAWLDSGIRTSDDLILDVAAALFETHDMQHGVSTLLSVGARAVEKHTKFKGS